jgi:cyclic pyranopterin phosphate synthase
MVVKRGANDGEILPMARHFRGSGHILRFIEYMDAGNANAWRAAEVIPAADVVRRIDTEFPLEAIDPNYPGEVAERWRYRDGAGEIGVIASVTQAFCSSCTRVRLSTDGRVYTCLFASEGHDLRQPLRAGADDAQLAATIADIWRRREDRYSELRGAGLAVVKKIEMSYIGG